MYNTLLETLKRIINALIINACNAPYCALYDLMNICNTLYLSIHCYTLRNVYAFKLISDGTKNLQIL